ncbi:unnamed protein product [Paramecium sonneborni]|uniref:Uncharacterized protein n=1 Tax=Paramecium sonneborni TaxID=65129 RepID=A0A8S1PGB2_9CILI|nr:unnamed protein product [Paramecium sonneborni]
MDEYIIDDRVNEQDRNYLLSQVDSIHTLYINREQIESIKQQLNSEDYITIHIALQKLLRLIFLEFHIENFPLDLDEAGNQYHFTQFIIENNIVPPLIHLIQVQYSIQSTIDSSQILICLLCGTSQQVEVILQYGLVSSLSLLLQSNIDLIAFTGLVAVLQAAKIRHSKPFCKQFLNSQCEQLIFKRYSKEPEFCLKTLYSLCTKKPSMKFELIKPSILFIVDKIHKENKIGIIAKCICIVTGKWIPLPPLKENHLKRIQLLLDLNIIPRFVQLMKKYESEYELLQVILTNLIFVLSGTDQQFQFVLKQGIMRQVQKLLDCKDNATFHRCLAFLVQITNKQLGVNYLFEQKSIISIVIRIYCVEQKEFALLKIVSIFENLISQGNVEQVQCLIDQQLIRIIIKNLRLNLNQDNVQLNCKTVELLQQLFTKVRNTNKDKYEMWKEEFIKLEGIQALRALTSQTEQIFSINEFLNT